MSLLPQYLILQELVLKHPSLGSVISCGTQLTQSVSLASPRITPRKGPPENLMLIAVIANLLMRPRAQTHPKGANKRRPGPPSPGLPVDSLLEQPPHDEQNEQWAVPSPCCWRLACLSVGSWGALLHFITHPTVCRSTLSLGASPVASLAGLLLHVNHTRFPRPPDHTIVFLHSSSRASFRLASLAHFYLHESTANLDSFREPGFPPEQATPAKTTRTKLSP
jgi:hypothetical protein